MVPTFVDWKQRKRFYKRISVAFDVLARCCVIEKTIEAKVDRYILEILQEAISIPKVGPTSIIVVKKDILEDLGVVETTHIE